MERGAAGKVAWRVSNSKDRKETFASRQVRRLPSHSFSTHPFERALHWPFKSIPTVKDISALRPHKRRTARWVRRETVKGIGNCPRRAVDYLYSLYDALVSINVPSDKARAVVDAMERDMGTTLATKQDLEMLKQAMDGRFALVDQKLETLGLKLTVKLGSMMVVGFGLTLAALRLWT